MRHCVLTHSHCVLTHRLWQNDGSWGFTAVGDGDNPFFNQSTVGGDRAAFAVRPMPGVAGYLELVQVRTQRSLP